MGLGVSAVFSSFLLVLVSQNEFFFTCGSPFVSRALRVGGDHVPDALGHRLALLAAPLLLLLVRVVVVARAEEGVSEAKHVALEGEGSGV